MQLDKIKQNIGTIGCGLVATVFVASSVYATKAGIGATNEAKTLEACKQEVLSHYAITSEKSEQETNLYAKTQDTSKISNEDVAKEVASYDNLIEKANEKADVSYAGLAVFGISGAVAGTATLLEHELRN